MTTDTRRKPLPGWETSPFARRTERAARMICGAAFPGIFLGSAFAGTMELLEYGSGLFGIPGVSLIIIALEAIFGAVLVGSWRERHGLRGILILPALLLKTTAAQITAIGWLNAVYMASAVFPAYALARAMGMNRRRTAFLVGVTAVLPTMSAASTFMSETVFLPLSLWQVYFFLRAMLAEPKARVG